MKLEGYYKIITSKIKNNKTEFVSEYSGYRFYLNRDNFYVADTGETLYVLDDTDNVMIQSRTGYKNVDIYDRIASEAFTDMIDHMSSKYYF